MLGSMVGFSGSADLTFDFQKFKTAADGHLVYTKMAKTSQPVCQSMWFLVLGWGFRLSSDFFSGAFIHALLSRVTLASARLSC